MTLSSDLLAALREAEEVIIETSAADGTVHRTTIWVVVDDADRVLVRTYLGPSTRWYREALARPNVVIEADGLRVPMTAEPAADSARVAAASAGYLTKYQRHRAAPMMVAEPNLPTTLELRPR